MRHVLNAEVNVPSPKNLPTPLLEISDFCLQLTVRVDGATVSCDTIEEMIVILKQVYSNELTNRKKAQ